MTSEPRNFARALRRRQTSSEDLLWQQLRGGRLDGCKFRRQVPLAGYVVDFISSSRSTVGSMRGKSITMRTAPAFSRVWDSPCCA
jgi:very-short-patch-repair endonuclease